MGRLAAAKRLFAGEGQLRYRGYSDDFGYKALSNWWDGLGGASDPIYVVQTNADDSPHATRFVFYISRSPLRLL